MVRRVAAIEEAYATVDTGLPDVIRNLVSRALTKIPDRDLQYLEVTEEGNPRRSFDINIYKAHLQVSEFYPALQTLCSRQGVSDETLHSVCNPILNKRFGHLAGGMDRAGNTFFTVYYGVEWVFGDSGRFPT